MNAKDFSKDLIRNSLKDIKVELDDEFDMNFQRKAFFANTWAKRKFDDNKGSLLVRSGNLRRSIHSELSNTELHYSSTEIYAAIHNDGGEIKVTPKMKRYFWAKYMEASGKFGHTSKGDRRKDKKNKALTAEADFFKAMALKKVGDKIIIPKRQFIGESPEVHNIIKEIVEENVQSFLNTLIDNQ